VALLKGPGLLNLKMVGLLQFLAGGNQCRNKWKVGVMGFMQHLNKAELV